MRLSILSLITLSTAIAQTAELRFEVASIRANTETNPFVATERSWGIGDGRVVLERIPLKYVILEAYGLREDQLSGPSWMDKESFDIRATAPAGTSKAQILQMMQALLIERFQMKIHRERKDSPVYALAVRKGTAPPQESTPDPAGDNSESVKFDRAKESVSGAVNGPYGRIHLTANNAGLRSEFEAVSMEGLAAYLSQGMAGLPVSDKTGLKGTYHIVLDVAMADLPGTPPASAIGNGTTAAEPSGYSVVSSLQKQGLDLVRERAPVEHLVIDNMERTPTPN